MISELYGKETGCAKGIGGSMHLIDLKAGVSAAVPIVGSTIPIGVGLSWNIKLKKRIIKQIKKAKKDLKPLNLIFFFTLKPPCNGEWYFAFLLEKFSIIKSEKININK